MNLLQKLSLMEENVEDWRELVESVKVDFNYDGAVLNPSVVDIPEEDELVKWLLPYSRRCRHDSASKSPTCSQSLWKKRWNNNL